MKSRLGLILFIIGMIMFFITMILAGLPSFNKRIAEINNKADLAIARSQESLGGR